MLRNCSNLFSEHIAWNDIILWNIKFTFDLESWIIWRNVKYIHAIANKMQSSKLLDKPWKLLLEQYVRTQIFEIQI